MRSSARDVRSAPCCGHCGYNLTAAPSNRCAECGLLFIEAGVIVPNRRQRRFVAKIVLGVIVFLLFPALIGLAMTFHHRARAAEAQARAAAARAAVQAANTQAVARFQQQMLSSLERGGGPQPAQPATP